jgi:hypothetical protein
MVFLQDEGCAVACYCACVNVEELLSLDTPLHVEMPTMKNFEANSLQEIPYSPHHYHSTTVIALLSLDSCGSMAAVRQPPRCCK